ncbi:MAG: dTDP-4-dehydrorhamnose reductase [Gammaproteobacteria bacterium]|jgi:dTDP-4-dehydrorhamnose reductase|nr:dTDP-4-dehydrorhamnose reductase [Gammaproteobacteria bacterium]
MKILLLGSNGQLGRELERQLSSVGSVAAFPRSALDITNHRAVTDAVLAIHPNIIVNSAAYTAVDKAETDAELANAVNAEAVANLAQIAQKERAWLIHYSTDYVFDGSKPTPYVETDATNPINVYGASKQAGEEAITAVDCQHLILRTSWVIGKDGNNFAKSILRLAAERNSLKVISDQLGVPTSPSLISKITIDAIRAIKQDKAWPRGIYHLAPQGVSSWHEIAKTVIAYAEQHRLPLNTQVADIQAITTAEYPTAAKRPLNSQLDTDKLQSQLSFDLPHWKDDFLAVARDIVKELETV